MNPIFWRDRDLIKVLESRGYKVTPTSLARTIISWNRAEPIPPAIEFKKEAMDKIKSQLNEDHIDFSTYTTPGWNREKVTEMQVHSARLRVFR